MNSCQFFVSTVCVGRNERVCTRRQEDLKLNCLKGGQFGPWLRAGYGAKSMGGTQEQKGPQDQGGSTKVLGPLLGVRSLCRGSWC